MTAVAVIAVFFILQQFRFFSIAGINPNLLLVGLLFFTFKTDRFRILGVLLATSLILALLFTPSWSFQVLVLLLTVIIFHFAKKILTGNLFLDFMISVLSGTFLFYLLAGLLSFDLNFSALIFWEILYNLIIGALMWYAAQKITN